MDAKQVAGVSYPIFIFNEAAIFRLVRLAAVLVKTQFEQLMKEYGVRGRIRTDISPSRRASLIPPSKH